MGRRRHIIAASGAPSTGSAAHVAGGRWPDGADPAEPRARRRRSSVAAVPPGSQAVLFTITALSGGIDAAQVAVLDLASGTCEDADSRREPGALRVERAPGLPRAAGALWAVAFDPDAPGDASAPPRRRAAGRDTADRRRPSSTSRRDGTLVYVASGGERRAADAGLGRSQGPRGADPGARHGPTRHAAVAGWHARRGGDRGSGDTTSGCGTSTQRRLTRVTPTGSWIEKPVWTPDGRRLVVHVASGRRARRAVLAGRRRQRHSRSA